MPQGGGMPEEDNGPAHRIPILLFGMQGRIKLVRAQERKRLILSRDMRAEFGRRT
jgi:hypothetical protein